MGCRRRRRRLPSPHDVLQVGREVNPIAIPREHRGESRLVDRNLPRLQRGHTLRRDVADDDVMTELREAGCCGEPDPACAETRQGVPGELATSVTDLEHMSFPAVRPRKHQDIVASQRLSPSCRPSGSFPDRRGVRGQCGSSERRRRGLAAAQRRGAGRIAQWHSPVSVGCAESVPGQRSLVESSGFGWKRPGQAVHSFIAALRARM